MIDKQSYELDYIRELQKKYSADPGLIERALYQLFQSRLCSFRRAL